MAALHAYAFTDGTRPWSVAEFAALLAQPGTFAPARTDGFALARVIGPEAELLTLAVHPAARRRGIGATLLADVLAQAELRGAREMFLEVAETNTAARRIYAAAGFAEVGRRPRYHMPAEGPPIDARVLRKLLAK